MVRDLKPQGERLGDCGFLLVPLIHHRFAKGAGILLRPLVVVDDEAEAEFNRFYRGQASRQWAGGLSSDHPPQSVRWIMLSVMAEPNISD